MIIPNKVESIGSEAFSDCTQLENIIINNPTVYFGLDIFENDYLLKMYCFKKSTAEEYANTYGIDYDSSLGIYSDKINITEQPDDIFAEKCKQATWKVTASGIFTSSIYDAPSNILSGILFIFPVILIFSNYNNYQKQNLLHVLTKGF